MYPEIGPELAGLDALKTRVDEVLILFCPHVLVQETGKDFAFENHIAPAFVFGERGGYGWFGVM